jgi:peptidase E
VSSGGPRLIVALGGGGFQLPPDNGRLDPFLLSLARDRSGRDRPRVCFIPTAMADADATVVDFYTAYAGQAEASHLALFQRTVDDIEAFLLAQDLIFVGGGNTANMLAIWRLHGADRALLAAWESGVVMSGMSAGAICWFEGFTTDSYGPTLRAVRDGLGVLGGSFIPHYHGELQRRPLFHRLVADGTLPPGYGVDDGTALVFHDTELAEVVTSYPEAGAWRVDVGDGEVREERLPARELPAAG